MLELSGSAMDGLTVYLNYLKPYALYPTMLAMS